MMSGSAYSAAKWCQAALLAAAYACGWELLFEAFGASPCSVRKSALPVHAFE